MQVIPKPEITLDKKWKVMQEVKKHVSSELLSITDEYKYNQFEFICSTVSWVVNENKYSHDGLAGEIRCDIDDILYPYDSLEDWLIGVHGIPKEVIYADNKRKLQTTRKAWVEWMIRDYKSRDE